jgi:hypothetical protein
MKIDEIYATPLDGEFSRFSVLWEAMLDEWEKLSAEVPASKHAYEVKYETEYQKSEGTIPDKKAKATIACKAEYLMHLNSEARLAFIKAKINWVSTEMSVLQTRAANMRAEANLSALPNVR